MQPHLTESGIELERLPTSEELPCSDDTPVDNEYQNMIPNWLLAILQQIWGERQDWFFGVDMGFTIGKRSESMPLLLSQMDFLVSESSGISEKLRDGSVMCFKKKMKSFPC